MMDELHLLENGGLQKVQLVSMLVADQVVA